VASDEVTQLGSRELVLLGSVFGVAVAGLVYELVAGTLSTYLLGSSVTVFSLVIGGFLFAMGMGAFVAKYVPDERAADVFVGSELAVAAIGGCSALVLLSAFALVGEGYGIVLAGTCLLVGGLVGIEIPLLLRILEQRVEIRVAVSHVLAIDYVGALVGSVAFPLLLLPWLGTVRAAALLGLLNVAVAMAALAVLEVRRPRRFVGWGAGIGAVLVGVILTGGGLTTFLEDQLYDDTVVLARSTPYQRVVVTRWRDDVRLFLEGHLQFSTADEYRYHEALVHPPMAAVARPRRVLILGGGDGLAVQRVLGHPEVEHVDLVDLDGELVALFRDHPALAALHGGALSDPRVTHHATDAVRFLEDSHERYDVILMDLPDPNDAGLSRLYAASTLRLVLRHLAADGALMTQATSPFYAPDAFWCIVRTLEHVVQGASGPARAVHPAHVHVPSFGEWGFVMVAPRSVQPDALAVRDDARFLDAHALGAMWRFPRDLQRRDVEVNRLESAALARYYRRGWAGFRE
jgi:spermidine synthase